MPFPRPFMVGIEAKRRWWTRFDGFRLPDKKIHKRWNFCASDNAYSVHLVCVQLQVGGAVSFKDVRQSTPALLSFTREDIVPLMAHRDYPKATRPPSSGTYEMALALPR